VLSVGLLWCYRDRGRFAGQEEEGGRGGSWGCGEEDEVWWILIGDEWGFDSALLNKFTFSSYYCVLNTYPTVWIPPSGDGIWKKTIIRSP
jgi:hypothetical protein